MVRRLFPLFIPLLLLAACGNRQESFPAADALTLLESTQNVVLSLSLCPPHPSQGLEAEELLREAYGGAADQVWHAFFAESLGEGDPEQRPRYSEGQFFPLIFHQHIQLSDAYLQDGELYVWEHYDGEDPVLQGFSRAHVFTKDSGGQWRFSRFEGAVSLTAPSLNPVYLPMKTEYAFL